MEEDDTLPEDIKMGVIRNVLNRRWFSSTLDGYYKNPSLWKDEIETERLTAIRL